MYKITDEVINFIEKTMKTWRVQLTTGGKTLLKQEYREAYSMEMRYHYSNL